MQSNRGISVYMILKKIRDPSLYIKPRVPKRGGEGSFPPGVWNEEATEKRLGDEKTRSFTSPPTSEPSRNEPVGDDGEGWMERGWMEMGKGKVPCCQCHTGYQQKKDVTKHEDYAFFT
jgi:hypothetical protein